jgi:hypothetical protein
MANSSVAITAGAGTNIDTVTVPSGDHRQVVILGSHGGHEGFAGTFRIPGRAGTTGQNLASIHNATGSTVAVRVKRISVHQTATVIKAVTVLPPMVRLYKVTVLPTNGTAITKVAEDSTDTATSASVTLLQDASADGTSSATTLTATIPAGTVVDSRFAPRMITAAGFDMNPAAEFLVNDLEYIVLNALQGIVVRLDYVLATQNPVTDMWMVNIHWEEYTP